MSVLQKPLQSRQVPVDRLGVRLVVVLRPVGLPAKGKHHLTAGVVCDYPHWVVECGAIGQRDVVIEYEVWVLRHEDHLNLAIGDSANQRPSRCSIEPLNPAAQLGRFVGFATYA